jgi:hypothetical protein
MLSDYDRCYQAYIENDEILIDTESYTDDECLWDQLSINQGYFYYNGNGKEFWIEKCPQPEDKFAKFIITTIDHYILLKQFKKNNLVDVRKEYENIKKQVVYSTPKQVAEYGSLMLKILNEIPDDQKPFRVINEDDYFENKPSVIARCDSIEEAKKISAQNYIFNTTVEQFIDGQWKRILINGMTYEQLKDFSESTDRAGKL